MKQVELHQPRLATTSHRICFHHYNTANPLVVSLLLRLSAITRISPTIEYSNAFLDDIFVPLYHTFADDTILLIRGNLSRRA